MASRKNVRKKGKLSLSNRSEKVPHGFGKLVYKDGDIEEACFRMGKILHPTRYKTNNSLLKTSYGYRFGTLVKIDTSNNVIVHPLHTGMPTIRLVI